MDDPTMPKTQKKGIEGIPAHAVARKTAARENISICGHDREDAKSVAVTNMTISIETCPVRKCRKEYAARYVFVHPLYNPCKSTNDIAIIELDSDTTGMSPICLAEESDEISGNAWTFGVKMDAEPSRIDVVKDLLLELKLTAWKEEDGKIKTRDEDVTLCGGKHGAPLFRYNRFGQATLFGTLADRDSDCSLSSKGNKVITGNFTDVRKHLDWICSLTGVCPLNKTASTAERLFEKDRISHGYCARGYTLSSDKSIINKRKCRVKRDDGKN
ncbi:hypothetical protein ANCCEY_00365 [Ancylostoma ceylanicum]|uniref:Peptidase S1 domain-containing protein n=1 Tax=Ancylostoma ceylanicum TaxID=53326 RepID=A0A0D6MA70_9BILA|nr:hypothetical protein ANCCEY_00365 [Ancylostoma ceylanicum]